MFLLFGYIWPCFSCLVTFDYIQFPSSHLGRFGDIWFCYMWWYLFYLDMLFTVWLYLTMFLLFGYTWFCLVTSGSVEPNIWSCLVTSGPVWSHMALFDQIWSCLSCLLTFGSVCSIWLYFIMFVLYGQVWLHLAVLVKFGPVWLHLALFGHIWSCLPCLLTFGTDCSIWLCFIMFVLFGHVCYFWNCVLFS